MNTLEYILTKYNLDANSKSPIEIRNTDRVTLANLLEELGLNKGAEIGTEQGVYAQTMCDANPDIELHCVDAWMAYKGYRDHVSQDKLDRFLNDTKDRLSAYNCHFHRGYSMDIVGEFQDGSLDFVYIDANHELPFVLPDIIEWSKKVKKGGIVSGHDYYQSNRYDSKNHVVYAVDAYTRSYRIKPWFILGARDKQEGEKRDKSRSWFFVKT